MEKPAVKNYSLIKNDPFNKQPKLGTSFDHKKSHMCRGFCAALAPGVTNRHTQVPPEQKFPSF